MKNLRRIVVGLMVFLLAMGSLVWSAGKTITLTALFMKQAGYSEEDTTAGTREFEKLNPYIKVQLTFVPYESLEQKIITSAQSGSYDVVLSDAPFTPKFAQAGIVRELPKLSPADLEDIFSGAIAASMYKDKLYGMPWLSDCKYLFYNKKLLRNAGFNGPPKTWDELLIQARVIKEQNLVQYPIVWSWAQAECLICDYTTLAYAFGGSLIDKKGKPQLNNSGNKKALDFMVNSIKDGISNPKSTEFTEEDVRGTFSSGNAAFAVNWTYMYNLAKDPKESRVSEDVGITLIPGSGNIVSATVNGGQPLSISAGTKHPKEAWNYIKYMSSKTFQKKYCQNALPIWASLFNDPTVAASNPDVVKVAKDQYKYIVNRPQVPYYSELSTYMQVKIQESLLGKRSSEEALKDAQAKALELAKKK